jgi:hypothetical protein
MRCCCRRVGGCRSSTRWEVVDATPTPRASRTSTATPAAPATRARTSRPFDAMRWAATAVQKISWPSALTTRPSASSPPRRSRVTAMAAQGRAMEGEAGWSWSSSAAPLRPVRHSHIRSISQPRTFFLFVPHVSRELRLSVCLSVCVPISDAGLGIGYARFAPTEQKSSAGGLLASHPHYNQWVSTTLPSLPPSRCRCRCCSRWQRLCVSSVHLHAY